MLLFLTRQPTELMYMVGLNSTLLGSIESLMRLNFVVHAVPDWYHALVPLTGGSPTPAWDVATHLAFMNSLSEYHLLFD
jgi:hypothetical protein